MWMTWRAQLIWPYRQQRRMEHDPVHGERLCGVEDDILPVAGSNQHHQCWWVGEQAMLYWCSTGHREMLQRFTRASFYHLCPHRSQRIAM
jgi:hypothetical protein